MPVLIDTDIAIHLRDDTVAIASRVRQLDARPAISVITRVELENGVYREPEHAGLRRAALNRFLHGTTVFDFTDDVANTYAKVIPDTGYSRRKVNDRMIAATALTHGLTFATLNASDFRDIADLKLEDWALAG